MKHYYVTYMSPAGPGASFYRGEKHPLHKTEMNGFCDSIARRIATATATVVRPEHIIFIAVIELPEDVAASHFPNDFPSSATNPAHLRIFELADGTRARGDAAKNILLDPPFGTIPEDARIVSIGIDIEKRFDNVKS